LKPRPPLFPDSAIRPLGTLHLTLGVMSLTTKDRLDEATSFLNSLDIEQMLRETTSNDADVSQQQQSSTEEEENSLAPISVSLQSLYALPKAKAATVLYAKPVDPTSRLYPLGVKLRERFVEAGLIQPDYLKTKPRKGSKVIDNNNTSQNDIPAQTETPKPKLRPLLLHATIVNTIYARGGHSAQNRGKDRRRGGPLTFDARDMLTHHHDFYTDDTCVEAKKHDVSDSSFLEDAESDRSSESNDESSSSMSTQEEAHPSRTVQQITPETADREKYPFVWARNFHIEKVCICEMGAKAVVDGDGDPLGARLGQKYRVVAERSLSSF
jgi:activating signal cointegrator complex subunit 1